MKLYIGGYGQGQKEYARSRNPESDIFEDFHLWIRGMLQAGRPAEELAEEFMDTHPDAVIVSDETGNGIVPLEPFEREYRERLGRILIRVAERSDSVERVICGLGQRLK